MLSYLKLFFRFGLFLYVAISPVTARAYTFDIKIIGSSFPILSAKTDIPENTRLLVMVKKAYLPDAQQRLVERLAACEPNCLPATGGDMQFGYLVQVENGRFRTGPFSFSGKPFLDGDYVIEISLSANLDKGSSLEQLKSIGQIVGRSSVHIGSAIQRADTPSEYHRPRYFISGFLLRAGNVCLLTSKQYIEAAFDLLSPVVIREFTKSHAVITEQWSLEGAADFNAVDGDIGDACAYAQVVFEKARGSLKASQ